MRWKAYKLGDILERKREIANIQEDKNYKLVTIKLRHQGVVLREIKKGDEIKSNMYFVSEGDFVLSGIDARNGAFGIVPKELDKAVVTNDFWVLEPKKGTLTKDFFLFLTSTKFFDYICKQCSDGTTQRIRLQKDKFNDFEISLPSIDAQELLVGTLMGYKNLNHNLSSECTHQLSLVKQLRQAFLREAMQGKLVAQDPQDEPAAQLLAKIKAEKERFIGEKKIKKEKEMAPIGVEEMPFEVPEGWVCCRLGEITINRDGDRKPISQADREKRKKLFDYYGASGVIDKIDGYTHEGKFVLIGEDGANLIAKSTPIAFIASGKFWVNNHAHVLEYQYDVMNYYMTYCLNTLDIKPYITGGFQPKLSQGNLGLMLIPLPPLAEQHRIVAKLDELMRYCDALEASIQASRVQNEGLLQQVLREALEPGNGE